ncbi:DNA-processing protein DprA [Sansalvadorimonas sp. 2012CJ34-2]|uniref:DNA-processing protein DprA n=1 Tax=Parendozoicomonas callyspongiae TaxID=2942213 RepID=A0ABT0PGH3_9GAMM|nr:DNA-processing protein DprA [Sansalvadorimonas sp. 2012CJ34-2]MCL6270443.1 DNA-processing protein DprA [Sansalvadorimonas sp. 2012CJ34-2]
MSISENTQAILLLNAYFSKSEKGAARPLTPTEWARFALWLKDKQLSPDQLLHEKPGELLEGWQDKKITQDRIQSLLGRGNALALALEKWHRAGLWVITRSDECYPKRLKARLGTLAPPVFFGVGNKDLLNHGGLAVIGSRNATQADLDFTTAIGEKSASEGFSIVSGGARGVDETAMLGALNAQGTSVGVMADSLLKAAMARKWRSHLSNKSLALISPFNPEAGFNAGNAMARNKYVYCMADSALVIHSGTKGGTWNGALENLKKGWVPLWVKPTEDQSAGNQEIVAQGAQWCESILENISIGALLTSQKSIDSSRSSTSLGLSFEQVESERTELHLEKEMFAETIPDDIAETTTPADHVSETQEEENLHPDKEEKEQTSELVQEDVERALQPEEQDSSNPGSLYDYFLLHLATLCKAPTTADDISKDLELHKSQVKEWLLRAINDGKIERQSRPVRYRWKNKTASSQQDLEGF